MITGNEPTSPCEVKYDENGLMKDHQIGDYGVFQNYGLTKRECFASTATDINEDEYTLDACIEIMGSELPHGKLEGIKWWLSVRAKLRLMYADALIAELNNQPL